MPKLVTVDVTADGITKPAYEPLEPGVYDLEVVEVGDIKTSEKGLKYLRVSLKDAASGKTVDTTLMLEGKMKWKTNQFAAAAALTQYDDGSVDFEEALGRSVRTLVKQRAYVPKDSATGEPVLTNDIDEFVVE